MDNDIQWLASMSDDGLETEIRGLASRVAGRPLGWVGHRPASDTYREEWLVTVR